MKKLRESRQTMQDVERLIEILLDELDNHRYLVYRMYLKHGLEMEGGKLEVPDTLNFSFDLNSIEAKLYITDGEKIKPMETQYQEILRRFKELSE